MEEFPNTSFVLDKEKNILFINGAEIFSGMIDNTDIAIKLKEMVAPVDR